MKFTQAVSRYVNLKSIMEKHNADILSLTTKDFYTKEIIETKYGFFGRYLTHKTMYQIARSNGDDIEKAIDKEYQYNLTIYSGAIHDYTKNTIDAIELLSKLLSGNGMDVEAYEKEFVKKIVEHEEYVRG